MDLAGHGIGREEFVPCFPTPGLLEDRQIRCMPTTSRLKVARPAGYEARKGGVLVVDIHTAFSSVLLAPTP